jgi:signal transduction histidine kinase/ActR/RegA family two-component response regulator/HAMP domain-containing protein
MATDRMLSAWPIRRKLLLLLSLIFLPAFAIILASGLKQRSEEINKARNNALLLAESLTAQQQQIATSTKVLLTTLADTPALQQIDARACNRLFVELNQRFPVYSAILAAATPDGNMFAASKPFKPGTVNLADRKHIKDAIRTLDFSAGEYMTGRVSAMQTMNYTYPVLNRKGKLVAVVIAGFSLDEYERFVKMVSMPPGYSVTIVDWKGTRLFRMPVDPNTDVGMAIANESMTIMSGGGNQGFFERVSADGMDRVYAYSKLRVDKAATPYMYVLVGIPQREILHRANLQMLNNLSLLGVAAAMALFLAWAFGEFFLLEPIKRLVAATQRLGRGEMDIRTGLHHSGDELGQLAQSFDDMAALLESKNLERRHAEEALSQANAELEQRVKERTAELSSLNAALTLEVNERKRAEHELSESRWHLQKAMDAAKLGVWRRDLSSGELICDERTKAIFGAAPDLPLNHEQLLNRIPAEDRAAFGRLFAEQEGDIDVEYRIASADCGVRWVRVRGSWMPDESGRASRVTGVVTDITEQKTAEQQMRSLEEQFRHSQKMEAVGRLAGGVAHDFNNLLLVINGHAELIAETAGLGEGVRRQLQAIHQAGQRAAQLTSHLLAFSRKQNVEPKTFELDQAVAGLEKIIRRITPENIELQTKLGAGKAGIRIAPEQLEQIIMNLVLNARDAMPTGGRLSIDTSCEECDRSMSRQLGDLVPGQYVVLAISDSGHGMEPRVRERIFEPFFTTKPLGRGTGLGLSTVYGIARQNSGGVHVYSEPGKGSTFRIYFPLCQPTADQRSAMPATATPTGAETVLLAEDEGAVRNLVRQHLEELGYKVLAVADGAQALRIARQNIETIDIVLTDVVMPEMGGYELSKALRQLRPDMKVVLMTGYAEGVTTEEASAAGLQILSKPFSRSSLAHKIREVLDAGAPVFSARWPEMRGKMRVV